MPYAPALESPTDVGLRDRYGCYIGGAWVAPAAGAYAVAENPATDASLAFVARASEADVDRAVRAARRAYDKSWRKLKPAERAKYLYRLARAIAERTRALAITETLDTGAPVRSVREVVGHAAATAFYFAGWADKLAWAVRGHERAHACGVVGALVSTRAPLAYAIDLVAPALAAGNTIVLKPATSASLAALTLAQLCDEIELPAGVVNVVTGDADLGATLIDNAECDLFAFEGTAAVASSVRRVVAGRRTRLRAHADGPSCVLVFEDAALDAATEAIVAATYRAGTKAARSGMLALVQESVVDDLVARVTARLATLRHGDPLDRNTDVGAFPTRGHRDRVAARVERAVADGARLVSASWTAPEIGAFRAAGILVDAAPSFDVRSDDAAGPLVALGTFRTPAEGIERAAAIAPVTAGVFGTAGAQTLFAAQRLSAGVVWCNATDRFDPGSPLGGGATDSNHVGGLAALRAYLDL